MIDDELKLISWFSIKVANLKKTVLLLSCYILSEWVLEPKRTFLLYLSLLTPLIWILVTISCSELISDLLLWTPSHGRAKIGRPARTYIQQLCADMECSPENLPEAMDDREGISVLMARRDDDDFLFAQNQNSIAWLSFGKCISKENIFKEINSIFN